MRTASQGSASCRSLRSCTCHSQTLSPAASCRVTSCVIPRDSPRQVKRSAVPPLSQRASAPATTTTSGSTPPVRTHRRPMPPASGEPSVRFTMMRRPSCTCSMAKIPPLGRTLIWKPVALRRCVSARSSARGVLRSCVLVVGTGLRSGCHAMPAIRRKVTAAQLVSDKKQLRSATAKVMCRPHNGDAESDALRATRRARAPQPHR